MTGQKIQYSSTMVRHETILWLCFQMWKWIVNISKKNKFNIPYVFDKSICIVEFEINEIDFWFAINILWVELHKYLKCILYKIQRMNRNSITFTEQFQFQNLKWDMNLFIFVLC